MIEALNKRPESFLWGVSTSGYQHEGGYNNRGEPLNNWAAWETNRHVAPSGRSIDFWKLYREDFKLARSIGVNSFRLGIEWARLQPTLDSRSRKMPAYDLSSLTHYAEMIQAALEEGLTPLVTLFHFTHPNWLGPDPWLEEKNIELFTNHCLETVEWINHRLVKGGQEPLRWIITINEANILTLNQYILGIFPGSFKRGPLYAQKALVNLYTAHVRIYTRLKKLYRTHQWGVVNISTNNFCHDLYWVDRVWYDILHSGRKKTPLHDLPLYLKRRAGEFDRDFREAKLPLKKDLSYFFGMMARKLQMLMLPKLFTENSIRPLWEEMYESDESSFMDYIAFDYYDPFSAHAFRWPVWWDWEYETKSLRMQMLQAVTSKWWDWRMLPEGLLFFIRSYAKFFPGYDLVIAENGMATRRSFHNKLYHRFDRVQRSTYLAAHLEAVNQAMTAGLPLKGYFHWSLADNYEWGSYAPRFGLYSIDFMQGTRRVPVDPFGDNPSETYRRLIQKYTSGF